MYEIKTEVSFTLIYQPVNCSGSGVDSWDAHASLGAVASGGKTRQMEKGGNHFKHLILICCHKPAKALNDLCLA